jgi:hypothetical protein
MGDYNNLSMWIPVVPDDDRENGGLRLGANDCHQGSCFELPGDLDRIIAEGVEEVECKTCKGEGEIKAASLAEDDRECPDCEGGGYVSLPPADFAYLVHDEPKYEWMGTITIHVPGFGEDFQGDCDADGRPMLDGSKILPLIDKATDLDDLKAKIKLVSGQAHLDALGAWAEQQRTVGAVP